MNQMGLCVPNNNQDKRNTDRPSDLKVGNLNYSGIQESPYQFYEEQSKQEMEINRIFAEVCEKHVKNFNDPKFKWKMGKMDKEWHSRFTPIYHRNCGVKQNKKMMNQQEFKKQWDITFDKEFPKHETKIYGKMSDLDKQKVIPEQKQECKLYDLSAYETLLTFIYKIKDIIDIDLNAQPYIDHQQTTFHKPFLDEKLKLSTTLKGIKSAQIDVFFIQQGDGKLAEMLQKEVHKEFYLLDNYKNHQESMILIRRSKFPKIKDYEQENLDFRKEYLKRSGNQPDHDLNLNKDSIFQAVGKILLMSVHLTSKKQQNQKQMKQMKESIQKFRNIFPEYHIIIGGDLNADLQFGFDIKNKNHEIERIYVEPDIADHTTVYKKRTLIQAQKNKANTLSNGVKDYLVSSLKIHSCEVVTIDHRKVVKGKDMPYLPNAGHPYDHFLVLGLIQIP